MFPYKGLRPGHPRAALSKMDCDTEVVEADTFRTGDPCCNSGNVPIEKEIGHAAPLVHPFSLQL